MLKGSTRDHFYIERGGNTSVGIKPTPVILVTKPILFIYMEMLIKANLATEEYLKQLIQIIFQNTPFFFFINIITPIYSFKNYLNFKIINTCCQAK